MSALVPAIVIACAFALISIWFFTSFHSSKRGRADAHYLALCFYLPLALAVLVASLFFQIFWLTALAPSGACLLLFFYLHLWRS